jgi:ubiquinone/menaquinone biosynthesis C-methylase UbiE
MIEGDLIRWIREDGEKFLREIGIRSGQRVLDFGCGKGDYTIPLSKLVGNQGIVYALDKNNSARIKLKKKTEAKNVKNVKLISNKNRFYIKDKSLDVVLCYDVLHYMNLQDRRMAYDYIRKVLKENGLFSVYPKHCIGNIPAGELADIAVENVIKEIEETGFFLNRKVQNELLHDSCLEEGIVLNFRKGGENAMDRR